jgi:hypothetical protein
MNQSVKSSATKRRKHPVIQNKDIYRIGRYAAEKYKGDIEKLKAFQLEFTDFVMQLGKQHPEMRMAANDMWNVVIALSFAVVKLEKNSEPKEEI